MKDQTRNLNPTAPACVAMIIYGKQYAEFGGGSMDFWDYLSETAKRKCELVVKSVLDHK